MGRIFCLSDVHTDFPPNLAWVQSLSDHDYRQDCVLLAGDVSDKLELVRATLALFTSKFARVFFVPGNHDLWIGAGEPFPSSLTKLEHIVQMCEELGVATRPGEFEDVLVVPLLSWYHEDWDQEPDLPLSLPPLAHTAVDYHRCKWPAPLTHGSPALASHFDSLNAEVAVPAGKHVISFSHFLPRQELMPEKRVLLYPHLPKMSGSSFLRKRIEALRPAVHVFGHTHFGWDMALDGVRFIQAPLAYPSERAKFSHLPISATPLCLYDPAAGFCAPVAPTFSQQYEQRPRDPSNTRPAPWVLAHYRDRR